MKNNKNLLLQAKKQISKEKPRCALCGKFFGIDEVINDSIVSVTRQGHQFQSEDQWYEHIRCRK